MNNVKLEGSTMPIVNYPKIRPTDYALFQSVLHGDLPASSKERRQQDRRVAPR
jgi:hypothetical protein